MLRKLAIAIAASGALMSATSVHALGMGDIELDSALNQPLDAHIKLLKAGELEDWEIKPDLASSDEFQKSGIERVFFLNNVKFEIERADDGVFIKLSTQEAVVEPFLNFLVQVDWPNGRLLREYTLLLDPPVFAEEPSAPVRAPQTQEFEEAPEMESDLPGTGVSQPEAMVEESDPYEAVESDTQEEYVDETAEVSEPEQQTYEVRNNDTLWEVALKTRPNRSISPQQAMLAIQDLNPESFINGNINRLKKNQILRIPSEEQINARGFSEAVSEVAVQNNVIKQRNAQLDATRKVETIDREEEVRGAELKLLTGGEATSETQRSASGEVMSETAGDQSTLDNELSLALENLDKSQRDNKELSNRLDALEEQINTLQRIINLKDEQMVALQAGFSQSEVEQIKVAVDDLAAVETNEIVEPNEEEAVVDSATVVVTGEAADSSETDEGQKADLNFAAAEDQVKQEEKPKAKPAPVASLPEAGDEEFNAVALVMDNIELFGGALGALLLTLLLVNRSRKNKEDEELVDPEEMAAFDGADPLEQVGEELEGNLDDEFADLEMGGDIDELAEDAATGESDVAGLEGGSGKESENADVLGEAEIYIAYDRMDQARTLLEKTVEAQPGRMDIRVKLLEVLSAMGDGDSFAEHYDHVLAQGNEEEQEKANAHREALDLEGSAEDSDALANSNELGLDDDLGLSSDLESNNDADLDFEGIDLDSDEGDLNFDLDGLGLEEGNSSADVNDALNDFDTSLDLEPSKEEGQDDDLSLEFGSLDLGDDASNESPLAEPDNALTSSESGLDDFDLEADLDFDIPELPGDDEALSESTDLESQDLDALALEDELVDIDLTDDLSLESEQSESLADLDTDISLDASMNLESEALELDNDIPSLDSSVDSDLDDLSALDLSLDESSDLDMSLGDLELDSSQEEVVTLDNELDVPELESDTSLNDEDLDLATLDSSDNLSLSDNELDLDLGLDESELPSIEGLDDDLLDDLDQLSVDLDTDDVAKAPPIVENSSAVEGEKSSFDLPSLEENDLDLTDLDGDLDFLSGTDESETKLDLARAYIDMDDQDGAREILEEVLEDGTEQQKQDAGRLMDSLV